jgi:hypothetical protein
MIKCAFDREEKCSALKEKRCEGCRFFKSKEKLAEGREKAEQRIRTLPVRMRKHIFDKYYAGVRPHKEET